jgi:CMP/dCMP kinase
MTVITISRQYGSGGDEIVDKICQTMGYQLFDKHILAKAAIEAGLSDQEVIDYSEDNHKVQGFFERLFGRPRTLAQVRVWTEGADGVRTSEEMSLSEDHALSLARKAIQTAYQMGNMVIIGRGGQMILEHCPDVLHIRIEAPIEARIQRLRSHPEMLGRSYGASYEVRRAAQDLIEASDAASADYLKRFYSVDWADPTLYHIIVNTGKLTLDQAAHFIIEAARILEPAKEAV